MKILISGDWHFTLKQPGSRRDTILDVFYDKLSQICNLVKNHDIDVLIQPGDMFDSHKANDETKSCLISVLNNHFQKDLTEIFTVYGQHDLRYHQSNVINTPLHLLHSAQYLTVLNPKPLQYDDGKNRIDFYGASWNEEIPQPTHKDNFNILVMHKMVISEKLWQKQEDFIQDNIFLKTNKDFDLIVSGDNHTTFTATSGDRHLVNAGCLVRTKIDQEDHRPCIFIFDTDNPKSIVQYYLSIKPFNDVIKFEEAKKEKEENETLKQYAEALKSNTQLTGINYRQNIYKYLKDNKDKVSPGMNNFIEKVFKRTEKNAS